MGRSPGPPLCSENQQSHAAAEPSVTACFSKCEREAPDIVAAGVDYPQNFHILWISAYYYYST
jgi:hypothetical protein